MARPTGGAKQEKSTQLKPPWKPGQSGNPKGRKPTGFALAEIVREHGKQEDPKENKARVLVLLDRLYRSAMKGNVQAIEAYFNRGWGKPPQPVTGDEEGGPVRLVVDWQGKAGRE